MDKTPSDIERFQLRPLRPDDGKRVVFLGEAADMGTLDITVETTVATDAEDNVIGFLRISTHGGIRYVNPIVVDPSWHGKGVGTALMQQAVFRYGEVRFVARGSSRRFYEKLGCEAIPWSMIAPEIMSDCDGCDRAETCAPCPMRLGKPQKPVLPTA